MLTTVGFLLAWLCWSLPMCAMTQDAVPTRFTKEQLQKALLSIADGDDTLNSLVKRSNENEAELLLLLAHKSSPDRWNVERRIPTRAFRVLVSNPQTAERAMIAALKANNEELDQFVVGLAPKYLSAAAFRDSYVEWLSRQSTDMPATRDALCETWWQRADLSDGPTVLEALLPRVISRLQAPEIDKETVSEYDVRGTARWIEFLGRNCDPQDQDVWAVVQQIEAEGLSRFTNDDAHEDTSSVIRASMPSLSDAMLFAKVNLGDQAAIDQFAAEAQIGSPKVRLARLDKLRLLHPTLATQKLAMDLLTDKSELPLSVAPAHSKEQPKKRACDFAMDAVATWNPKLGVAPGRMRIYSVADLESARTYLQSATTRAGRASWRWELDRGRIRVGGNATLVIHDVQSLNNLSDLSIQLGETEAARLGNDCVCIVENGKAFVLLGIPCPRVSGEAIRSPNSDKSNIAFVNPGRNSIVLKVGEIVLGKRTITVVPLNSSESAPAVTDSNPAKYPEGALEAWVAVVKACGDGRNPKASLTAEKLQLARESLDAIGDHPEWSGLANIILTYADKTVTSEHAESKRLAAEQKKQDLNQHITSEFGKTVQKRLVEKQKRKP